MGSVSRAAPCCVSNKNQARRASCSSDAVMPVNVNAAQSVRTRLGYCHSQLSVKSF